MQPISLAALAAAKGHPPEFLAQLGLADSPRGVVIAYRGRDDAPPLLKLRAGLAASTSRWPAGQPLLPYGRCRWTLSLEKGFLILVEGESDCWALWRHGFPALGLPGAGAAGCLDADDLAGLDALYIHQEPDAAGATFPAGVARRLAQLGYLGKVYVFTLPDCKDPADLHLFCAAGADSAGNATFADYLDRCLAAAQELDLRPYFLAAVRSTSRGSTPRLALRGDMEHGPDLAANPLAELTEPEYAGKMRETPPTPRAWLWHGLIAPGAVTLLTAVWKSGKTTLIAALLNQFGVEGGTLAGRAVSRAKALILSEEAKDVWHERLDRFGIPDNILFWCRPFPGKPFPEQWEPFLLRMAELCEREAIALVVVDPLASFLPVNDENDNAKLMRFLASFQRLTRAGVGVLILHHPRKGQAQEGQMARGGGALCGFVDVIVEMTRVQGGPDDRRRVLSVYSRFAESPKSVCVKLNPTGSGFDDLGDAKTAEHGDRWRTVRAILDAAPRPLTAKEILERWPEGEEVLGEASFSVTLRRAVEDGEVVRLGKGGKHDPFRYHLPGKPPILDPLDPASLMADWTKPDILHALRL